MSTAREWPPIAVKAARERTQLAVQNRTRRAIVPFPFRLLRPKQRLSSGSGLYRLGKSLLNLAISGLAGSSSRCHCRDAAPKRGTRSALEIAALILDLQTMEKSWRKSL